MKHLSYLFVTFIIVAIFVGCKETTKKNVVKVIVLKKEQKWSKLMIMIIIKY